MIAREEINGLIFIAQTTYYIYKSEEDLQNSKPTVVCSQEKIFNQKQRTCKKERRTENR
jgi:hypothetical protein